MLLKKAQAWGFDLVIASVIFTFGVVIFLLYTLNDPGNQDNLNDLEYEGNNIANQIMSEGFPINWDQDNFVRIGILSENRINETKLEVFYNLSVENYQKTRENFETKYNYFINLTEPIIIDETNIAGIGIYSNETKNLIKITRFTIYKDNPVTLNVYVWE